MCTCRMGWRERPLLPRSARRRGPVGSLVQTERVAVGEHPDPTTATVKALYALAFRCAKPDCQRPLYRLDDETGNRTLNSRVAHIHARSPGGPRWIEMTAEENRAASNLFLLCIEHSYEIDEHPAAYPADLLREWKQGQLDEHDRLQQNWGLTDAQAGDVLQASRAGEQVHADAVMGAVRAATRLALAAREARSVPARTATAWRDARDREHARMPIYDLDGNRLQVELPRIESRQHGAALQGALAAARDQLTPLAHEVKVELAAVRASRPSITAWCDWVERCVDVVIVASSEWPAPPQPDDQELENATQSLEVAAEGLAAAWRDRSSAPEPPPAPPEQAAVDDGPDPLQDHRDLLDRARPFARVDHRPYDEALRGQLTAAAEAAATIPPIPSALPIGLRTTCMLAVAVAGNATDEQLAGLADQDAQRQPLCAAVMLLEETMLAFDRRHRLAIVAYAQAAMHGRLEAVDWSDRASWQGNEAHGNDLFRSASRCTSPEQVRDNLAQALHGNPAILLDMITSCATWQERRDSDDWRLLGFGRTYHELPQWFPTDAVVTAAAAVAPAVRPASDDWHDSDDPRSLLAQVLRLANAT